MRSLLSPCFGFLALATLTLACGGSAVVDDAAGSGGTGAVGSCENVGCGQAPLCATGCTVACGCCPCSRGEARTVDGGKQVCQPEGCWAPVAGPGCAHLGVQHATGETFAAGDGCNTCTCQASGTALCTRSACACDPATETNQRRYLGTPDKCALIDFVCDPATTYFSNACGCGCEQSPSCPDTLDCMPGGAPDTCNVGLCPYSLRAL